MARFALRKRPCGTCPYRRDVPPGVWAASEYDKLPGYDGDVPDQLTAGATGLFSCHRAPELLCAGWAGCHDMRNNLAVRLHWRMISDMGALLDYASPVPLFASGAEAAAHGKSNLDNPGPEARAKQLELLRVISRRNRRKP